MVEQSKPLLYFLVGLASVFIIISGIRDLSFILNPILLAIVITVTLLPLPAWFAAHGVPGWLSLVLTFLIVLLVIGLILLLVFVGLTQVAEFLPTMRAAALVEAEQTIGNQASAVGLQIEQISQVIEEFLLSQRLSNMLTSLLATLFTGVSQAFLVMVIFAFMLSSALALPSSSRLGLRADHPLVLRAASLTADVRRYITLTTVINLLVGLGNTILLLVLGVDLALLWGLLSVFLGYIPAIGFWLAMIPPLVLAYVESGLWAAAIVFVGYALINGSVENLVKPRLMGQQLRISPVVVVISLFVWGWLLGGVGAILSTPLTLLILSILEGFHGTRWITVLLRSAGMGEPVDPAERQAAFGRVRGLWDRAMDTVRGGPPAAE